MEMLTKLGYLLPRTQKLHGTSDTFGLFAMWWLIPKSKDEYLDSYNLEGFYAIVRNLSGT
jgi:hypothetical protein